MATFHGLIGVRRLMRKARQLAKRRDQSMAMNVCVEPLEPRLMMAADLVGFFQPFEPGQSDADLGERVSVEVIYRNDGDARTPGRIDADVYLYDTATFDPATAVMIAQTKLPGGLNPGVQRERQVRLTIPTNITPGDWRLAMVLDPENKIVENNDDNNTAISDQGQIIQPGWDLVASLSRLKLPGSIITGSPTAGLAVLKLQNTGGDRLPPRLKVDVTVVARPVGAVDDSSDVLLNKRTVNANVTGLAGQRMRGAAVPLLVPDTLPAGEYDIIAMVDGTQMVTETNENNNELTLTSSPVVVADPFYDLRVEPQLLRLPGAVVQGDAAGGLAVVKLYNQGNDKLPRGQKVDVSVVARPVGASDDSADVVLNRREVNANVSNLLGTRGRTVRMPLLVPDNLPADQYDILVLADTQQVIADSEPGNNEAMLSDTPVVVSEPFVDLAVQDFSHTFAANAQTGDTAQGRVRVTNLGTDRGQGQIDVTFYASTDDVLDGSDVVLGTRENVQVNLAGGALSGLINVSLSLPASLDSGEFNVLVDVQVSAGSTLVDANLLNGLAVVGTPIDVTRIEPGASVFGLDYGSIFSFTRTGGANSGGNTDIDIAGNRVLIEMGRFTDEFGRVGSYAMSFGIAGGVRTGSLNLTYDEDQGVPAPYFRQVVMTFNAGRGSAFHNRTVEFMPTSGGSVGTITFIASGSQAFFKFV